MGNNSFKTYRQRAGLSQKDVALKLNVSQGAVSAWESGRNRPDIEMAQKVANLYNVSVDELISSDQQPRLWKPINVELVPDDSDGSDFIPLVASLRCGWGSNGDAFTVIKKVEVSSSYKRKWGPDIKIVEAEGNSMLTTIRPGDYLICIPGDYWRDGNIVVIDINDSDTIKRIYRAKDGGIDLIPDNKQYKAMHYSPEELKDYHIHVLGRVAKVIGPDLL